MKRFVLLLVAVIGLTACGGGGGGTADTPTPVGTSVSMASFKGVFLGTATGAQYSFPALLGSDSQGRGWSGSFTVVADGATTFEAQNVTKRRSLVTLQIAGGTPVSSTTTSYFLVSDGSAYKSISSSGVTYIPTSQTLIPATIKVGDFGTIGAASGSDGTTSTTTWALNADVNGASILAISSIIKTGVTITGTEVDSFYLDASGVPTKLAISVTVNTVNPPVTVNISGLKN
jgi:hypothetical protein